MCTMSPSYLPPSLTPWILLTSFMLTTETYLDGVMLKIRTTETEKYEELFCMFYSLIIYEPNYLT